MTLSEKERAVLRQMDAFLEREDPELARSMGLLSSPGEPTARWPRRVVVGIAVAAAIAVLFVLTAVTHAMRPRCDAPLPPTNPVSEGAVSRSPSGASDLRSC